MCKVTKQALSSLASQVDVTDVVNLYHEFFTSNQDGEANSFVDETQLSITFGTAEKGADPGVEIESSMTREKLASDLDFVNELPLLFNANRHKGGLSPWSNPNTFNNSSSPDLEPLTLFWHQLAGVTLIADEVGLGKMFQAATVIVFLADLAMRQQESFRIPPLISSSSLQFFCRLLRKRF